MRHFFCGRCKQPFGFRSTCRSKQCRARSTAVDRQASVPPTAKRQRIAGLPTGRTPAPSGPALLASRSIDAVAGQPRLLLDETLDAVMAAMPDEDLEALAACLFDDAPFVAGDGRVTSV